MKYCEYLKLFYCFMWFYACENSSIPIIGNEALAGEEIAGEEIAGEEIAGEEIAGEEIAGEDSSDASISGGTTSSDHDSHSMNTQVDGLVIRAEMDFGSVSELDQDIREFDLMTRSEDMGIVDMQLPSDMMGMDMLLEDILDSGIPIDERCDPRLRAPACEPGFACIPIPGGQVSQGQCVAGDGCMLMNESGCPEDQPYCHLHGRSTVCTQPSVRGRGEVCLDEFNRALPCAEGLVCNFSVCVPPCDPTQNAGEQCGRGEECVDLTDQLEQVGGFCGAIATCDLFTNLGCEANQQCNFAVRPDDQKIVYFCSAQGSVAEGEPCQVQQGQGAGDCGPGLICIASPEGSNYCKRLCDTGAYQAPCPDGQSCREVLSQGGGRFIRTIGLCIVNP